MSKSKAVAKTATQTYEEMSTKCLKENKSVILDALKDANATKVLVSYSGSGDSGGIDFVQVFRKKTDITDTLEAIEVEIIGVCHRWNYDEFNPETKKTKYTLTKALEEFVSDWIAVHHPGWYNNDGADGEATITVTGGKFELSHNEHHTQSENYEYSL